MPLIRLVCLRWLFRQSAITPLWIVHALFVGDLFDDGEPLGLTLIVKAPLRALFPVTRLDLFITRPSHPDVHSVSAERTSPVQSFRGIQFGVAKAKGCFLVAGAGHILPSIRPHTVG